MDPITFYQAKLDEHKTDTWVTYHEGIMSYHSSSGFKELVHDNIENGTRLHEFLSRVVDLTFCDQGIYMQVLAINLLHYMLDLKKGEIDGQAFSTGLKNISEWFGSERWKSLFLPERFDTCYFHEDDLDMLRGYPETNWCAAVIEDDDDTSSTYSNSPHLRTPSPDKKPRAKRRKINVGYWTPGHDKENSPAGHHRKSPPRLNGSAIKVNNKRKDMDSTYEGTDTSVMEVKRLDHDHDLGRKRLENGHDIATKKMTNEHELKMKCIEQNHQLKVLQAKASPMGPPHGTPSPFQPVEHQVFARTLYQGGMQPGYLQQPVYHQHLGASQSMQQMLHYNSASSSKAKPKYESIVELSTEGDWPTSKDILSEVPTCTGTNGNHEWRKVAHGSFECSCTKDFGLGYHARLRVKKLGGGKFNVQYDEANPNRCVHSNGQHVNPPSANGTTWIDGLI